MQDVQDLGEFDVDSAVIFFWNTIDSTGASVVRGTNGTLRIYRDAISTERSSLAGVVDTEGYDSLTGLNFCSIDLSDDTDIGLYEAGSVYHVVVAGMILGAVTQNRCIARFTIAGSPVIREEDIASEFDLGVIVRDNVRFPMG
jgi:hypothetical protein